MKIYLDDRLLTDKAEIEKIEKILNRESDIDDGLVITADQFKTVYDCTVFHSEEHLFFSIEKYERKDNVNDNTYNFSCVNEVNYSNYYCTEQHLYTDHNKAQKEISRLTVKQFFN